MLNWRQFGAVVLLSIGPVSALWAQAVDCKVQQSLSMRLGQSSGVLQLCIDSRFDESVQKLLWGKGDWSVILPKRSAEYRAFATKPPRPVELVVIDDHKRVVSRITLVSALARVEPLDKSNLMFLVTEDRTTVNGSYAGLRTSIWEATAKGVFIAGAMDSSGKRNPIYLTRTLKSDWQIEGGNDGTPEILAVSSQPNANDDFMIRYDRYVAHNGSWSKSSREEPGIWESDEPFPDSSHFR